MKITGFEIAQRAEHAEQSKILKESLMDVRQGNNNVQIASSQSQKQFQLQNYEQLAVLTLSEEGLQKANENRNDMVIQYSDEDLRKIELLEAFMSHVLGKNFKFRHVPRDSEGNVKNNQAKGAPPQVPGSQPNSMPVAAGNSAPAFRLTQRSVVEESERVSFQSKGSMQTSDGLSINFEVNFDYQRSYRQEEVTVVQSANFHDPIVLDLTGQGLSLSDKTIKLDLDIDGTVDQFRAFGEHVGILVQDTNGDGIVNSGMEVIGAQSGQGFETLRALDTDQSGFLDEGDLAFNDLKLWLVDQSGGQKLIGLTEAGVGALYLGSIETPFKFKEGLDTQAIMKQSSIYVKNDGRVLGLHEVDLKI